MKKLIIFLICLLIMLFVVSCMPTRVKTPQFKPKGTFYREAQNVEITCSTDGATIYYTTNGSEPNTSSSVYSSPIAVTETTTIKAYATNGELDDSSVATATYTINEPLYALDFALYNKDSEIVSLYDFTTEYIHLDFSAGWCTYCKQQAAYMDDAEDLFQSEGINIKV
jgi:thiol-disulfide isomerase/thioredoxin